MPVATSHKRMSDCPVCSAKFQTASSLPSREKQVSNEQFSSEQSPRLSSKRLSTLAEGTCNKHISSGAMLRILPSGANTAWDPNGINLSLIFLIVQGLP
jgi:hypothetical protein